MLEEVREERTRPVAPGRTGNLAELLTTASKENTLPHGKIRTTCREKKNRETAIMERLCFLSGDWLCLWELALFNPWDTQGLGGEVWSEWVSQGARGIQTQSDLRRNWHFTGVEETTIVNPKSIFLVIILNTGIEAQSLINKSEQIYSLLYWNRSDVKRSGNAGSLDLTRRRKQTVRRQNCRYYTGSTVDRFWLRKQQDQTWVKQVFKYTEGCVFMLKLAGIMYITKPAPWDTQDACKHSRTSVLRGYFYVPCLIYTCE